MTFEAFDGGLNLPEQPDWGLRFDSAEECMAAAQYWCWIIEAMRAADTVNRANGPAIARLVVFQIVYDRASTAVARDGAIRKVRGIDRKNPNLMAMRQASEVCSSLEAELSLSPLKRRRAGKVARRIFRRTPADEFLPIK
jgi:phage terminase small subunit